MSGPISPPLTVTTVSGSPSGRPITTIKVSNGDLTISGSTATIDTSGGGGGGSGTVTSIATTAPITGGTITTTGTIGISQADGSTDGFLSSTDWNTFDAKQGAITLTTTGTSGTASLVGTTLNIPNYTNSSTIGGTIANTQVAYGSATDAIQGSANLTFDGSNLSVGGYIKSGGIYDTTGATDLVLKTNGGTNSGTLTLKNGVGGNAIFQPDGTGVFQFNGVSGGNDGAIKLMCSEGTHSQTISAAPHASAATYSLVLPTGLPADADNKYLVSDTSGNMSFTSASGGGIGGAITDNQVAYGDLTANDIEGNAKFTYDVSTQTLDIAAGAGNGTLQSGSSDLILRNSSAAAHSKITLGYDTANSNIVLDTDGSGLVEIHKEGALAYSLPNVVTGANDYVLTAQTDGTTAWAAAGGGGGASTLAALTDVSMDITNFTDGLLIQTNSGGSAPTTGTLSSANNNIGIGKDVFSTLTTGDNNVVLGNNAGDALNSGARNVLLGHNSGSAIESGQKNVIIGANAMELGATAATFNVGIGFGSMGNVGNGADSNVAIGGSSLSVVSGDSNIAIGYTAGDNITSGEANVVIGKADVPSATGDRQLSISSGDGGVTWITGTSAGVVNIPGSLTVAGSAVGNDFNVELCGTELDATGSSYPVFDVMALAPYGVARFNTLSVDTKQYFFPFISPFSGDVGTMLYNITSAAGSATNLYMAIYTDNNGVPDEVLGYATLDATVDGSQTTTSFSSTITLVRGTQYYMAYNKSTSESISMRAIDNSYLPRIAPSSGFPSTTNGYSTGIVSNSNVSSAPSQTSADDLEPAVYFAGLGGRPHIGLKV